MSRNSEKGPKRTVWGPGLGCLVGVYPRQTAGVEPNATATDRFGHVAIGGFALAVTCEKGVVSAAGAEDPDRSRSGEAWTSETGDANRRHQIAMGEYPAEFQVVRTVMGSSDCDRRAGH